jgi:hypothetical protein
MEFLNEIFYNMFLKILIIEFFKTHINHLAQHPMNKSGTTQVYVTKVTFLVHLIMIALECNKFD